MKDRTLRASVIGQPWHPILFAIYPILYLFGRNVGYALPIEVLRPLLAVLTATAMVWGLAWCIVRDRHRAASVTTTLLGLFFLYGEYSTTWYQLALVLFVGALLAGALATNARAASRATRPLNVFGAVLVTIALVSILRGYLDIRELSIQPVPPGSEASPANRPNIYYIIVDGYGRDDVLREFYDHDNSAFTNFLRDQGFFVHPQARANYPWTVLSLASSLNFVHAVTIAETQNLTGSSEAPMWGAIYNNRAMALARGQGYDTYAFLSGVLRGNTVGADHFFRPEWATTEFEQALLNFTPVPSLLWALPLPSLFDLHRRSLLDTVAALKQAPDLPSPRFVFSHLVCPHPPFVFGPNGESVDPPTPKFGLDDGSMIVGETMTVEEYRKGYRAQLIYINTLLEDLIGELRERDPEAVIVLQGDHGPASMTDWFSLEKTNMRERFGILNAVFLPGEHPELAESFRTPVNTFGLIFNTYFGTSVEPSADTSYFVIYGAPYQFYPLVFPEDR